MAKPILLKILLILLLVGDFSYSFLDYYSMGLDGDLSGGIVPAPDVQGVFDDPTGFKAIINNENHPNPNRYFAHLLFRDYFRTMPFFFQKIVSPIESIYFSCAFAKLLMHALLLFFLVSIISRTKNIFDINFLIVAVLIMPLFQSHGFYGTMGIIDKATTYSFFYALPLLFLLWYFSYFYAIVYNNKLKLNFFEIIILILLTIILPLSGPLIPAVIIIVSVLLFFFYFKKQHEKDRLNPVHSKFIDTFKSIPLNIKLFFLPVSVLSIYSLFLGTYNSTYPPDLLSLTDRYIRLSVGIYYEITHNIGIPILIAIVVLNIAIIKKYFVNKDGQKIIKSFYWIGLFFIIYILLLPLGGYRPYRHNILRYDTFLPVTIGLIYMYGISTFFLLKQIKKRKNIYIALVITILLVFTIADKSNFDENKCQKLALQEIADSNKKSVVIQSNCTVLTWEKIYDYQLSALNAELLWFWNITDEKKLYIND